MPWGYWKIDPNSICARHGAPIPVDEIRDHSADYLLVGCEPNTMYKPGLEPQGFRWWWRDNSFLPHLRYPTAANPTADKFWSRLTYCGWGLPHDTEGVCTAPVMQSHRDRINQRLSTRSGKQITEISQLWGGTRDQQPIHQRHALILLSSRRNYKNFYDTTPEIWLQNITSVLADEGYTWTVRDKPGPQARLGNQITDAIADTGCDLVIANHSAGASEAALCGVPVVTTSPWNPARPVSTTWEDFCAGVEPHAFKAKQLDRWVTQCCAYTYHREELDMLSWVAVHPEAGHLRAQLTEE